jgi:hypothetical protein
MHLARTLATCALAVALGVLSFGGLRSEDKKDAKPKVKGQLPQGWSKLGLSDEQKDEVFKLQDEHKRQVDELEEQIAIQDVKLGKARLGLFTDEQRKTLREMREREPDPKEDKDTKPEERRPLGWQKLNLTDAQKSELFKAQREHLDAVEKFKHEIAQLDAQLVSDRLKVLSGEQRKTLREAVVGDLPPKDKK